MRRSGWFERRLLVTLVLFALVPSVVLVAAGTVLLAEGASLQTNPAGWERLAETGRQLLSGVEASNDADLRAAAERHRAELAASIQQAQRWGYLNRRVLAVLPWVAAGFFLVLVALTLRFGLWIAGELARPVRELIGWSRRVARAEPLPPPATGGSEEAGEFGVLRDSFRSMARELAESRARALEAARLQGSIALARGVAHELKNALTPLQLAVRALERDSVRAETDREAIAVIRAESRRLETLARAFSQFGRIPEGTPSTIDLPELLRHLARTHLPVNVQHQLTSHPDLPSVNGHYDALSRAFANLLLNAVEAVGDEGGEIAISAMPQDGEVEVCIRDSGPGLPSGEEERVWDPDFTTKARGTGLGLALVRQTVLAHGGRVAAATHPEGGAVFRIFLPEAGAAAGTPLPLSPAAAR